MGCAASKAKPFAKPQRPLQVPTESHHPDLARREIYFVGPRKSGKTTTQQLLWSNNPVNPAHSVDLLRYYQVSIRSLVLRSVVRFCRDTITASFGGGDILENDKDARVARTYLLHCYTRTRTGPPRSVGLQLSPRAGLRANQDECQFFLYLPQIFTLRHSLLCRRLWAACGYVDCDPVTYFWERIEQISHKGYIPAEEALRSCPRNTGQTTLTRIPPGSVNDSSEVDLLELGGCRSWIRCIQVAIELANSDNTKDASILYFVSLTDCFDSEESALSQALDGFGMLNQAKKTVPVHLVLTKYDRFQENIQAGHFSSSLLDNGSFFATFEDGREDVDALFGFVLQRFKVALKRNLNGVCVVRNPHNGSKVCVGNYDSLFAMEPLGEGGMLREFCG